MSPLNALTRATRADSGRRSLLLQAASPKIPARRSGLACSRLAGAVPIRAPRWSVLVVTSRQWVPVGTAKRC